jgi:hypothetical protein
MWGFFAVGLVGMACAIGWLLRRYAAPSVPYIVLAATAYAWAVSMSIVLITPIDVWAALKHQPERGISILWRITYWSTQVMQVAAASSKCRTCRLLFDVSCRLMQHCWLVLL